MPYKRLLLSLLTSLVFSVSTQAESHFSKQKEEMPQAIIGLSTYLGALRDEDNNQAYYVGASLYAFVFNSSLEIRSNMDDFDRDNQIQPYAGIGLGRLLQVQRSIDFSDTNRFRLVTEIAFDEWIDTRNHIILQGFIEQVHSSSDNDRRVGLALGYTF